MFLHGGFLHVAGNMLYLWIFGDNVEDRMGHGRFLVFYLLCGDCRRAGPDDHGSEFARSRWSAPAAPSPASWARTSSSTLTRGSSRCCRSSSSCQIIEVPAIFFLGIWFVMQFLSGVGSIATATGGEPAGGVAFWAHVAGFAAGIVGVFVFKQPERERVEWWNDV